MYTVNLDPRLCRTDDEVEAMRGRSAKANHYEYLIAEDAIVVERNVGVIARLVTNTLPESMVTDAAKLMCTVHGDLSNRGTVVYRGAMMPRELSDGSPSNTMAVPSSILRLLHEQNARIGLSGPYADVLGYLDKNPRTPFCRETAWSLARPDILEVSRPLVAEVERVYQQECRDPWRRQREFMRRVSEDFRYHNSVFSTMTVNLNLRCRYHTDRGDFRGGMGNLVVLELGRDDSGILVMPRERVAFLVRPGDLLLMNVHHMHGNLPLTVGGTRLTAVLYARELINKCH